MEPIDLRSDLLSRPTEAMIDAMSRAARDAPGFLPREDPWVQRLERYAAELLGKQDALFCPTCTLANQVAIHLHCRPGDIVLTEQGSHVAGSEGGAAAACSGVSVREIPGPAGEWDFDHLSSSIPKGPVPAGRQRASLLVLENTHNRSGGGVLPRARDAELRAFADSHGLAIHLDGARLFHAAVSTGTSIRNLAVSADSVAVSLGKGLCAPLGAILAGDADFIAAAEQVRQRFGGGWRPAGIVAAAGLIGLESMIERLADDHKKARRFADLVQHLPGLEVANAPVPTNIVLLKFASNRDLSILTRQLWNAGLRLLEFDRQVLRAVFYKDIDDQQVCRSAEILQNTLNQAE